MATGTKKATKPIKKPAAKKTPTRKPTPATPKVADRSPATAVDTAIDVVFSFDDTGSMAPCRSQVRREIRQTAEQLFKDIPNLRIGIMVHGDYCDPGDPVTTLELTADKDQITNFVAKSTRYRGGDAPECYELVLHQARSMNWRAGKHKVLVLIGDNVPHGPTYPLNRLKLDWRNELGLLLDAGIHVHGVQALGYGEADKFYGKIAEKTGGFHLRLEQFSQITALVKAVCYQQAGQLEVFERTIVSPTPSLTRIIDTLAGRKPSAKRTRGY